MPGEDAQEALSALSNAQLLARLDGTLLELEKRLFRYAKVGPELLQMADEGLVWPYEREPAWARPSQPRSTRKGTYRFSPWATGAHGAHGRRGTTIRA